MPGNDPTLSEKPLGQLILSHLRSTTAANAWPEDDLKQIQVCLRNAQVFCNRYQNYSPTRMALCTWIATLPRADSDRINAALPDDANIFTFTLLPALLIWACEQPWGTTININTIETFNQNLTRFNKAPSKPTKILALQTMSAITNDVVGDVQGALAAWHYVGLWVLPGTLWSDIWENWTQKEAYSEQYFDIWLNIGLAAETADKKSPPDGKSTPLADRWASAFFSIQESLSSEQESRFFKRLVASELSASLKYSLCNSARVATLIQDDVCRFMKTEWPACEAGLIHWLPWTNNGDFNAEVARVYIPHAAALVDVLATPAIWSRSSQLLELLEQLTKPASIAPLLNMTPGIFDDSSPS